ncbi:MAG: hypothetical protein LBF15_04140 [Candidatus Peribacteria bacterium]|jgi:hypothetical protein|nr:hypothetical protein [Candidatus Peribacteria bacterium]
MLELNKEILIYLNSLLDFRVIEKIALIFADAPIFLVPLFLIIAWIYQNIKHKGKNEEKKKDLIFIFYACLIAFIINLSIQHFVHFDRPESVIEGV